MGVGESGSFCSFKKRRISRITLCSWSRVNLSRPVLVMYSSTASHSTGNMALKLESYTLPFTLENILSGLVDL